MRARSKCLAVAVVAASVAAATWSGATSANGAVPARIGRAMYDPPIARSVAERAALLSAPAAGTTVPQYAYAVTTGGHTYRGRIVGKNPRIAQANPVTTIP